MSYSWWNRLVVNRGPMKGRHAAQHFDTAAFAKHVLLPPKLLLHLNRLDTRTIKFVFWYGKFNKLTWNPQLLVQFQTSSILLSLRLHWVRINQFQIHALIHNTKRVFISTSNQFEFHKINKCGDLKNSAPGTCAYCSGWRTTATETQTPSASVTKRLQDIVRQAKTVAVVLSLCAVNPKTMRL